jgi:hypothetical protein
MKKAIVDIDGILWSMGPTWDKVIKRDYPECPMPGHGKNGEKAKWKFYDGYMTEEQMQKTVLEVHMRQPEFQSFQSAGRLTKSLTRAGYHVTIASHRNPITKAPTEEWLKLRDIPYDDIYIGMDKHFLLDDADLFIDDSPLSQKIALDKGVEVFSIQYDYNEHMEGVNFFPDFFNLMIGLTYWIRTDGGNIHEHRRDTVHGFNNGSVRQASQRF